MMQGRPGGNGSYEEYWNQASFSFKFCCLTSTFLFMASLILPAIMIFCIDIPQLTIWSFQVWRLFICMYGQLPNAFSILSIVFSFMWIYNSLKDSEHSTVYKLFEIILINLQIHLVFNLISLLFTILLETQKTIFFYGYGWFPIILVYQFRTSVINPEGDRRFCCLPFLIKNKYYPWVLLLLLSIFSMQFLCFVSCAIVGYYQQTVRKEMFIKLPMSFYRRVQSIFPEQIKARPDFVKISTVENMLKSKCYRPTEARQADDHHDNPYAYQHQPQSQFQQGQVQRNMHSIGGNPVVDFRNYWAQKDSGTGTKSSVNGAEIEIEPKHNYLNQDNSRNRENENENNSYARFSEDIAHNFQSLDGQQEKQKEFENKENARKGIQKGKDLGSDLI